MSVSVRKRKVLPEPITVVMRRALPTSRDIIRVTISDLNRSKSPTTKDSGFRAILCEGFANGIANNENKKHPAK